jgi:hypothetical protein
MTPQLGSGIAAAPAASDDLDRLLAGAIGWLGCNLDFFDPFSEPGRSASHKKVKAALELALLRHCWARLAPDDGRLCPVTARIRALWQRHAFRQLLDAEPCYARQYGLIYTALAPADVRAPGQVTPVLPMASQRLAPPGLSPYHRLETRCYAEKARIAHAIEPCPGLFEQSLPAASPGRECSGDAPLTIRQAYTLTHAAFYISDFGFHPPQATRSSLRRASGLAGQMLDYCVCQDRWDLIAELVLAQHCLGGDPAGSAAGVAGIRSLLRAQSSSGAIPARSAALKAQAPVSAAEFFRKAYHPTIVTALMSLTVISVRQQRP